MHVSSPFTFLLHSLDKMPMLILTTFTFPLKTVKEKKYTPIDIFEISSEHNCNTFHILYSLLIDAVNS